MSGAEKRCFAACWATYVGAYLCRVNLSTALDKLPLHFAAQTYALGAMGSVFFVVYALGQLINGYWGDRIAPALTVTVACLGTALCNVFIAMSDDLWKITVLWGANGFFQSMFWGPLMRVLSERLPRDARARASAGMTTSIVTGFMLTWSVMGYALHDANWRANFFYPGFAALAAGILWSLPLRRGVRSGAPLCRGALRSSGIWKTIREEGVGIFCVACAFLGLVKESLTYWAPILLVRATGMEIRRSFIYILLIPLFNMAGIWFSSAVAKRFAGDIRKTLRVLFGGMTLASFALSACRADWPAFVVVGIAVISAMAYGCNNILLAYIPIAFGEKGVVSTLIGVFDFCSYCGAAVSVFALGLVLTASQWRAVPAVWGASAAGALAVLAASSARIKRFARISKTVKGECGHAASSSAE